MQASVLIVDDDRTILKVLRGYLEQAGHIVYEASDGEMALYMLRRERPDLVVLDVMLPKRNGQDLTRIIRNDKTLVATPIIMLTARTAENDKIIGLELGADDYVTKPFNVHEVIARVNALLRRRNLDLLPNAAPNILRVGELHLDLDARVLTIAGRAIDLTRAEFNLIEIFMKHLGYTLNRDELLEKALGYSHDGLGRTLDTHIRNLRRKIEPNPETPIYIQTVYGIGYRMEKPVK